MVPSILLNGDLSIKTHKPWDLSYWLLIPMDISTNTLVKMEKKSSIPHKTTIISLLSIIKKMAASSLLEVKIMLFDYMINKPKRSNLNLKAYSGTKQDIVIVSFVWNSQKMTLTWSFQVVGIKMYLLNYLI